MNLKFYVLSINSVICKNENIDLLFSFSLLIFFFIYPLSEKKVEKNSFPAYTNSSETGNNCSIAKSNPYSKNIPIPSQQNPKVESTPMNDEMNSSFKECHLHFQRIGEKIRRNLDLSMREFLKLVQSSKLEISEKMTNLTENAYFIIQSKFSLQTKQFEKLIEDMQNNSHTLQYYLVSETNKLNMFVKSEVHGFKRMYKCDRCLLKFFKDNNFFSFSS